MKEEDIKLLKRIQRYLHPTDYLNAVYMSPATSLRQQADKIEAQQEDEKLFDDLIKRLEFNPLKP